MKNLSQLGGNFAALGVMGVAALIVAAPVSFRAQWHLGDAFLAMPTLLLLANWQRLSPLLHTRLSELPGRIASDKDLAARTPPALQTAACFVAVVAIGFLTFG